MPKDEKKYTSAKTSIMPQFGIKDKSNKNDKQKQSLLTDSMEIKKFKIQDH